MPKGVLNIQEKALTVANEFARGEQFYECPKVPMETRGAERKFTLNGREYTLAAHNDYTGALAKYFGEVIGREWFQERLKTATGRTHPLFRIAQDAQEYSKMAVPKARAAGSSHYIHCGAQRELCTLSEDMVRLSLVDALPSDTVQRLKRRNLYQGTRYELAVAAAFVRLGFRITWLPTSRPGPEFVAHHPVTGDSIAVEAKSRHRGSEFQFVARTTNDAVKAIKADVGRLYSNACSKPTQGLPYAVFIDANIPYRGGSTDPLLAIDGLADSVAGGPLPTEESPAPEFLLCVTTCGWYYSLKSPAFPVKRVVMFPKWTTAGPRNFNTYVAAIQAINRMYTIPQSEDVPIALGEEIASSLAE